MRTKLWFITILPLKTDWTLNKTTNYSFLHKSGFFGLFSRQCWNLPLFFLLSPLVTSSKICSDSEPLLFCHRRLWCNIILKALWMERVTPAAFIWLSSFTYKSRRHQRFTLWFGGGKHQICTNGKRGGESSISDSNIVSFRLWSGANSGILSAPRNNMWKSTHTGTTCTNNLKNTIQVTAKEYGAFAIRKGTNGWFLSPENVWYWCKTIYLPHWYTGVLQQLNKKCGSLGFNICTKLFGVLIEMQQRFIENTALTLDLTVCHMAGMNVTTASRSVCSLSALFCLLWRGDAHAKTLTGVWGRVGHYLHDAFLPYSLITMPFIYWCCKRRAKKKKSN